MGHSELLLLIQILAFVIQYATCKGEANSEKHPSSEPQPNSALPLTGPSLEPQGKPVIIEGPKDEFFAKGDPAALYCNARGEPEPNIAWYYNSEELLFDPVTKYNDNRRMIMSDGQLFFLYFQRKSDVGTYYCIASNVHGSAISREATVDIAVIKDDFRQEPVNTTTPMSALAKLHCKPPSGKPEPEVVWLHNGKAVVPSDRIQVQESGDLIINSVTTQDSGEYVCVAQNRAGRKLSSTAVLKVLDIPKVTLEPEDVSADEGETVVFHCEISGDADIKWKKEGGAVNQQKWHILPDNTLQIENVAMADDGAYVCYGENTAGSAAATAHLKIEYVPKLEIRPQNQTVAIGRTVRLACRASGNPPPAVYWETKSQTNLMFANQRPDKCGRYCVTEDGTLRIERVQKSDEGEYTCQALSSKGKDQASATVTVTENDIRLPPIIVFGPQNQTLPLDGFALLGCHATGNPQPFIRWYKNDISLTVIDARFTFHSSGTLQISNLKVTDSGQYTCKAISETGETTAVATLIVQSSGTISTAPMKTVPDLTGLPPVPEKPVVSDVTDTSIRLTWQLLWGTGTSSVSSYQVEYFGYGVSETWEISRNQYTSSDVTIHGLVPNTTYVFLVRAKNSQGLGGPSPLSDHITTLEKRQGQYLKPYASLPDSQIESKLKEVEVQLVKGEAVNSTDIKISWQVKNEPGIIDGFVIQYKLILNMGDRQNQRYGKTFTKSVPYRPLSQIIGGLEGYEYYEMCVMAASGNRTSPCSPPMKIQSGESVPSGAPLNVGIHREHDTEMLVSWSSPGIENRKGVITGFQIKCFSEDGTHNCSKTTNGSTHSVLIDNLIPGLSYQVQIAAQTEKGVGKWSQTYSFGADQNAITKEPWFIVIIGVFGAVVWLGLCIFTVWLCKSHKRRKKLKDKSNTESAVAQDRKSDRNGSTVRKSYGVKDAHCPDSNDAHLPGEFSTLLQQFQHDSCDDPSDPAYDCSHPEMKTFYQQSGSVTPYATTALLQTQAQNSRKQNADQMCRQLPLQHSEGSGDSCGNRSITTDENGLIVKQQRKFGYHPGNSQNSAVINWNDVFPPPPNLPPPPNQPASDGDYSQEDQLYAEIPDDSMHTCIPSACSCVGAHTRQVPAGCATGGYSDYCNRCQSLRNFETVAYTPQQMLHLQRPQGILANFSRTLGPPSQRQVILRGGVATPVLCHGYSQPWDNQPMSKAMYDYAQVPRVEGCSYSQPIQDSLIEHSNPTQGRERNIQPLKGPYYPDNSLPNPGAYGDTSGGTQGNYCEGPCRGQVEVFNSNNTSYNRNRSDNSPYLDSYKIDSPPPSSAGGSEYRVCNSGGSCHSASTGGSGQMKSCLKGRSSGNDLRDQQLQSVGDHCRTGFHHSRSQTSSSHPIVDEGYSHNAESPLLEGDTNHIEGSENSEDRNERDSIVANWESTEDCSSVHSSLSNDSLDMEGQFVNEDDFASAVARAAELSGLTIVGSTISDPSPKPVKRIRHHRQARPPSPGYSTDSNYGTSDVPHKPYPKSERRKQLAEHSRLRKKAENESMSKGDNIDVTVTAQGNTPAEVNNVGDIQQNNVDISENPVGLKYSSLSLKKPTERNNVQELQKPSVLKAPIFQFSNDIPIV